MSTPTDSVAVDQEALIHRAYARVSELTLKVDQLEIAYVAMRQQLVQTEAQLQEARAERDAARASDGPTP